MMKVYEISTAVPNLAESSLHDISNLLIAMQSDIQGIKEKDFVYYRTIALECFSQISDSISEAICPFVEFLKQFEPSNPIEQEIFARSVVRLADIFKRGGNNEHLEEIIILDREPEAADDSHLSCSYDDAQKSSSAASKQLASLGALVTSLDEISNNVIMALRLIISPDAPVATGSGIPIASATKRYPRFPFAPSTDDTDVTERDYNNGDAIFRMDSDDEEQPYQAAGNFCP